MAENDTSNDSIPSLRDEADRDVINENTSQAGSIEGMIGKTKDEAERGRMTIKKRGNDLRAEIREIENTLLKNVDACEQTRLGILQRKKEELKEQRAYIDTYIAKADGEADEDRDICMLLCSGNVLAKVAVSDALDIKLEKDDSYQFTPANYGKLIVGTRPLKRLTKYDLRFKIEVTQIRHRDINVIEPTSNSQCWVTYKNKIRLYSRDGTLKFRFTVTDEVIDMETCQSGMNTFVALKNNHVLKLRRTGDIEYSSPTTVFRTQGSIGSIAVDSSNRIFVFDAEKPILHTYDEDGKNMSEKELPAIMRKVRSVGHHAVFAASITDNVVTIKTVNRSDGTAVTLAREGMEATQVCHCTRGFFAVLGYNTLKLHRFAEDGLFIDAYELGQRGLTSSDRQWFFRFSTFTVDGEGNIWIGDKHCNVKIYSPF